MHFAYRLPEVFVMLQNGVAEHGIERFIRKTGQSIGICVQDFEIGIAVRAVKVDADLGPGAVKCGQAQQTIVGWDCTHFQYVAASATPFADTLKPREYLWVQSFETYYSPADSC